MKAGLYQSHAPNRTPQEVSWPRTGIEPMTNYLFPDAEGLRNFSISHQDWSLHRKGPADQQRHQEKIKEAVRKNLGQIVSEESIILSDGQRTIKVPIRSLDEYHFRFDHGSGQHGGSGDGDSKVGDVIGQAGGQRAAGAGR